MPAVKTKEKKPFRRRNKVGNKLTAQRELFVKEYMKDLVAKNAAIRAGYSERSADIIGSQLLSDPYVSLKVKEALEERLRRTDISADWVLRKLLETHQRIEAMNNSDIRDIYDDRGRLKPIDEWPEIWRTKRGIKSVKVQETYEEQLVWDKTKKKHVKQRVLVGYLKEVIGHELTGPELRTLELLGKHTNVAAFVEKYLGGGGDNVQLKVVYEQPKPRQLDTRISDQTGHVTLIPKDTEPNENGSS